MKVYGVWYADYSNSRVGGAIYTDRDIAEAVCCETEGDLLEFDLDPSLEESTRRYLRPGERFYSVSMDINGNDAEAWPKYPKSDTPDESDAVSKDGKHFSSACWATDEKHAIKIVNERRGGWLAGGSRIGRLPGAPYWNKAIR